MTTVTHTLSIEAPVETVYQICNRPDFLIDLAPTGVAAEDVERTSDGGQRVTCVHNVRGITFDERVEFDWEDEERRIVETSDSTFLRSRTTYVFTPADGRTRAEITADVHVPIPFIGRVLEIVLIRVFLSSELEGLLANLRDRAEAGRPSMDT